jgi:aconitate decarboxylase
MGLNVAAMQHAIGLAATQVVGLRAMFGSHTKSFHPGRAAQNGLISALLAAKGYSSSLQALEAKRGWANVVSTSHNLLEQIESLGKTWEITHNAFKPFPCGLVVHSVIDAGIQLHSELSKLGITVPEISSVTAQVHAIVLELTANPEPKDELQSKFSVFHAGAVGIACGKAGIEQFSDAAANDPVIIELRRKINAVLDPTLEEDETVVKVTLKDGRQFEKHVVHAVGSLHVPMTDRQLEDKFKEQCLLIWKDPETVDRASEACWALEASTDVSIIANII